MPGNVYQTQTSASRTTPLASQRLQNGKLGSHNPLHTSVPTSPFPRLHVRKQEQPTLPVGDSACLWEEQHQEEEQRPASATRLPAQHRSPTLLKPPLETRHKPRLISRTLLFECIVSPFISPICPIPRRRLHHNYPIRRQRIGSLAASSDTTVWTLAMILTGNSSIAIALLQVQQSRNGLRSAKRPTSIRGQKRRMTVLSYRSLTREMQRIPLPVRRPPTTGKQCASLE